jgi:hypothetical protein
MLHAPPSETEEADFDEEPDDADVGPEELSARRGWWAWLAAALFLSGTAFGAFQAFRSYEHRPAPHVAEPPSINPTIETAVLAAIAPGWPGKRPLIETAGGPVEASEGHVTGLAAADVYGDGRLEWGVSFVWYGLPDADGGRAARPGFAVVTASDRPVLRYLAPPTGGWDGEKQGAFEATTELESSVEAVKPGPREVGFLFRYTAESSRGGHLTHGRARLYALSLGEWIQSWEGETEFRWRMGHNDEIARNASVRIEDRDGDGTAEIVVTPSHYFRHLTEGDHGAHFMADGPGDLIYRREGNMYRLAGLSAPGRVEMRIRPAPPLIAVRAPGPMVIDGDFSDWDTQELAEITGLRFDDLALLKYKRRDWEGLEDLGGEVNLMWDDKALYVRALVTDNVIVPGPPNADLYKGDNLSVWLDMELEKDFNRGLRDGDDWQVGLSPGLNGKAEAWCWVPKPGRNGVEAASKPLIDPNNGKTIGYQLEAAIPWAGLGGLPAGLQVRAAAVPMAAPTSTEPRRYHLALAGVAGIGLVLSDADTEYQELGFVSNPTFTWAEPKTFNTLFLVEPN